MGKDTFPEYLKTSLVTSVLTAILNTTDMKPFATQMIVWVDTQLIKKDVKKMSIKFADKLIELATAIVKEAEKL